MKRAIAIGMLAAAWAGPALAETSFSGNVALVTDYVFRGISQSNEDLALQGGFDLTDSSGFYAGLWASSIDFNDATDANLEVDLYGGYRGAFGESGWGYDVGVIYYAYPDADVSPEYNFVEVYGALSYAVENGPTLTGKISVSPEFFFESGTATYIEAMASMPLSEVFSVSGGVGYQDIEDAAAFGADSYTTFNIGGTASFAGFALDGRYFDSDAEDFAPGGTYFANNGDGRFVVKLSRAM
jgi:uncharacterized protein (TIGR02001 family)